MQNSNFQNFSNINTQPLWQEGVMNSQSNLGNPWLASNSKRSLSPKPLFDNIYQKVSDDRMRHIPDAPPAPVISKLGQIGGMVGGSDAFNMNMRMASNNQQILANMGAGMANPANFQNLVLNSPTNLMMGMMASSMANMPVDNSMMSMNNLSGGPWSSGGSSQTPQLGMKDPPWSKNKSVDSDLRLGLNRNRAKTAVRSRGRSPRRSPLRRSSPKSKSPIRSSRWAPNNSNSARNPMRRPFPGGRHASTSYAGSLSSKDKSPPRKKPNLTTSNVAPLLNANRRPTDSPGGGALAKRRRRAETRRRNAEMKKALNRSLLQCREKPNWHSSEKHDGKKSDEVKDDKKPNIESVTDTKKTHKDDQKKTDNGKDKSALTEKQTEAPAEDNSFLKRNKSFLVDDEESMYGINPGLQSDDERSYLSDDEADDVAAAYLSDEMIIVDEDGEDDEGGEKADQVAGEPTVDIKMETSSTKDDSADQPTLEEGKEGLLTWDEDKEENSGRDWQEERKSLDKLNEKLKYNIVKSDDMNDSAGSNRATVPALKIKIDRSPIPSPDSGKESENQAKEPVVKKINPEDSIIYKRIVDLDFNPLLDSFPLQDSDRMRIKAEICKVVLHSTTRRVLPDGMEFLKWPKSNHDPLRVNIILPSLQAISNTDGMIIMNELLQKLRGVRLSETGPQFTSLKMKKGYLLAICVNAESRAWLNSTVSKMTDREKCPLSLVDTIETEGKMIALQICVAGPLKKAPVDEIFSRLSEQNANINSASWIFLGRRVLHDKQVIAVAVGEMTARMVIANDMFLFLGFQKVIVRISCYLDDDIFGQFFQFLKWPNQVRSINPVADDMKKERS